jgi:transposase
VFVRRLRPEDQREVEQTVRRGGNQGSPVTWRRALVVLMSSQGRAAPEIARSLKATADWVRGVIHAFNALGLAALAPRWGGGRPRRITAEMRAEIVRIATTRPQLLGEPYTRWSLAKLRDYLLRSKVVPAISKERLREILAEEKVSIQRTKSWKRSPDPDFDAKAARIQQLYNDPFSTVVCFDELGPVSPIPQPGWGWAPEGLPQRVPANYKKPHGVRFFFGAYDVRADRLTGRWFERKGSANTLKLLKAVRRRYPASVRLHIVMDNLSSHWTDEVVGWAEQHNVELVPTPTYASWLNLIEPQFGQMVAFVIRDSEHRGHEELQRAAGAYLRRRNREATRNFAARQAEKARRRERRARRRAAAPPLAA